MYKQKQSEKEVLKNPCSFILTLDEQGKLDRAALKFTTINHQGTRTDVIKSLIAKLK